MKQSDPIQKLLQPFYTVLGPAGFAPVTKDHLTDAQGAEIQASGIPPTNNAESAIVVSLNSASPAKITEGMNRTSPLLTPEL